MRQYIFVGQDIFMEIPRCGLSGGEFLEIGANAKVRNTPSREPKVE